MQGRDTPARGIRFEGARDENEGVEAGRGERSDGNRQGDVNGSHDKEPTSAEHYLRAVIESTADGMLVVGRDGRVLLQNRRFAELWRIPDEVLATRNDERLVAFVLEQLEQPEAFLQKIRELYDSREQSLDLLRFKDGRIFERYSSPLIQDGEIAGRVWSFRDITQRRKAEEERRLLESRVRDTQRLESLGVLAGGIAHDFNNLLVGILGNADLAVALTSERSRVNSLLQDIVSASRQAADLCNELLAYSGKGSFVVKPVDLSEIVRDLAHLLEVSISKKIEVRYDFAHGLPPVDADVSQLRQVVMNLITNASDAIGHRPGVIEIATDCASYESEELRQSLLGSELEAGEYVSLRVSDTGYGMDADTRSRIFEPFFSTKSTGRGLGLAAILGIVRGHGGTILVESEVDRGSTFHVLLPSSTRTIAPAPPPPRLAPVRGDGRVLVVDDEEAVRKVAGRILEEAGFQVVQCSDGESAIEVLSGPDHGIQAVLLDLTMPGLDGIETLRALRELDPGVGVVLSSGYHAQATASRLAAEAGPVLFIQKPYRSLELVEHIREAMATARRIRT